MKRLIITDIVISVEENPEACKKKGDPKVY